MNINKRTVKMLDIAGRKVTVRESRLQIYLDLNWTVGWPKDEIAKDEQRTEIAEQPDAEEVVGNKVIADDQSEVIPPDAEAEDDIPETISTK